MCTCGRPHPVNLEAKKSKSKKSVPKKGVDPTKTVGLRRDYEKEFIRRWNKVLAAVLREVGTKNGFGLTTNKRFDFAESPTKVAAFQSWFSDLVNKQLFGGALTGAHDKGADHFWGNSFANIAYRRGLIGASGQIRRAGGRVSESYITDAVLRSKHGDAVKKLYSRAFEDLKDITTEVSRQIGTVLAEGLAASKGAFEIARAIAERVEKIGITRSRLLARTEIISAYNEAELNTYEDAGIAGVILEPEWLTAGDDRVCERCAAAAKEKWTVETARGAIPLHPNCRCAWMPLIVSGKEIELK